ncbi:MFS transporter [Neoroseomonas oryzicola]|uniref:MFS transporter n=1 Tax=Neoroseomonas oryzicola TaxID=535904 RepID=A0A9X9WLG1_9PROT|nr:MFS transporter [Neoroseomonas oryzicola]MBR0661171.1 MFS transporter [Neoroseomonas oryzicola]NKE17536.1 MFS transporter [Neoroseomonas oryzicola]
MHASTRPFHGWRVVAGAFVVAVFGWGLGFYGPPVYLHAVTATRGWPVALVSAAITVHYLAGAALVAVLPRLYARWGLAAVTRVGTVALAVGLCGWAASEEPWQLFAATLLTGGGWVTLGAAAINAMVAPWFVRLRPKALSSAYNGASVGGIVFSPLWVLLIERFGFLTAAAAVGLAAIVVVGWLMVRIVAVTPDDLGQVPDGEIAAATAAGGVEAAALPGPMLWRDPAFRSLAAGMALGLFAQIGLLAHLFSLIAGPLEPGLAGVVAGLATVAAILGRTLFGWLMPAGADRRRWACASYAVQAAGVVVLLASGLEGPVAILLGVLLFGFGIGNATSLPPLIAQAEFRREDVARAVPMIVAVAQATYAFAPAAFGLVRGWSGPGAGAMLVLTLVVQALAVVAFLAGRRRG